MSWMGWGARGGTEGEERLPKGETGKEGDDKGRLQARRKTVEVAGEDREGG